MREIGLTFGALFAVLIVVGVPISCSDVDSPLVPPTTPGEAEAAAHSVTIDGVRHGAGYCQPLENCAICHGSDLRGPADSCYECHGEKWDQPPCR